MNIEIANRLVQLRKEKGLSQEELAEQLGLSRQAVSKWERAEASPDTDNLILLSRLYGVSLDELLKTEDEIPDPEENETQQEEQEQQEKAYDPDSVSGGFNFKSDENSNVHIGPDGIHVTDDKNNVHVGWKGIHVEDEDGDRVHVGWDGIHVNEKGGDEVFVKNGKVTVNGEEKHFCRGKSFLHWFPWTACACLAYILCGAFSWLGGWGVAWIIFLMVPICSSLVTAIHRRNPSKFSFTFLAAVVFFVLGFFYNCWHPGWVVFLTIPIYYSITSAIRKARKSRSGHYFGSGANRD